MARVLKSKVCEKRHKYAPVHYDVAAVSLGERLSRDCFEVKTAKLSMECTDCASTSPSPSWWSPSATNVNCPVADLFLLRQCDAEGVVKAQDA
eukprot:1622766-Alexandrium_andersonii.AAC.1